MDLRSESASRPILPEADAADARAERLRALARLSLTIASSTDTEALLAEIAAAAAAATGAAHAWFWVFDEGAATTHPRVVPAGGAERTAPPESPRSGEGVAAWIATHRCPLDVAEVMADDRVGARDWWAARGLRSFLGLPVALDGSLLAALGLAGIAPFHLEPDDRAFLEALLAQAGLAIQKGRLLTETETRRRTAEALADLGRMVSEVLDPEVVGHRIVHGVRVLLGAQAAALLHLQPSTGNQVAVAVAGDMGPALGEPAGIPPGIGAVGLAVAERRAVSTPDLLADPRIALSPHLLAALAQAPIRAVLAVPMVVRDEVAGALLVGDRRGRVFDAEEVRLAQTFADQAALALENARLFSRERERRQQVEAVRDTGGEILRELDVSSLLDLVMRRAVELTEAGSGGLFLWDEGEQVLRPHAWRGHEAWVKDLAVRPGEGVTGIVAQRREALVVNNYREWPYAHPTLLEHTAMTACLGAPLLSEDRLLGVITVGDHGSGRPFTPQDREILSLFAAQAAVAVENARHYQEALRTAQEIAALSEAGQAITESLDLGATLTHIAETARRLGQATHATVWLADPGDGRLRAAAASGPQDPPLLGSSLALESAAPAARAVREGRLLAIPHALDPWGGDALPGGARGDAAVMAVPLCLQATVLGVLVYGYDRPREFTHAEVDRLSGLARHAAVALQNAQLHADAIRKRQEAEALQTLGRLISSTLDADEIVRVLLDRTCRTLGVSRCAIWESSQEGASVRLRLVRGVGLRSGDRTAITLGVDDGITCRSIARRAPVWTADLPADPALALSPETRWVEAEAQRAVCSAPILLPDGPFGALAIYHAEPHAFEAREVALLSALADQAAIAIQNARLYQQEQVRRRQMEAVREVTAEITRELNLPALLRLLHQRAASLVGASAGTVWLWDEAAEVLVPQLWSGDGEIPSHLRVRLGEGLVGLVAQRREGIVVDDYRRWPAAHPVLLEQTRIAAALGEPLLYHDRLVGVITVGTSAPERPFTEQDREILKLFAAHAAIAIENARLYQREQQRHRQVTAVRDVTADLLRELDLSALLGLIQWRAGELVGATAGAVYLWNETAQLLIPQAWFGFGDWMRAARIRFGEGITGTVAQQRDGLIVNDYPSYARAIPTFVERGGVAAAVAEPLLYRDRLVGVITLTRDASGESFTEQDRETFSLFAAQAAIAIENARLYQVERDRARDLAALIPAGRAIASSLDLPQILESIVASAAELTGAPLANLLLLSTEDGTLLWQVCAGRLREEFERATRALPMQVGESFSGQVAATRRSLWVPDVQADPREIYREFNAPHEIRCYLGVPILIGERLLGVLSVLGPRRSGVNEARRELLEMLAGHAALAIEHARIFRQEQERRRQVEAVREVTSEIIQELDLTALLGLITRRATELVGATSGAIFLWDEASLLLVPRAWVGLGDFMQEVRLRSGEGITGIVAQRREGMIVNDYRAWPHASTVWLVQTEITAALAEPLLYRERLLGVITLNHLEAGRPFTAQDRETLALFAGQAALAIENARLYGEAERQRREAEALAELARDINVSLDIGKMLRRAAEVAKDQCEAELAAVALREPQGEALVFRQLIGVRRPEAWSVRLEPGRGDGSFPFAPAEGIVAAMGAPIRSEHRVEGLLYVANRSPRPFTDRHEAILRRLADHAAIGIRNAQLFAREEAARAVAEASEERFRDLVQDLDAIVWEADASPFRYTFVSQRAEALLGYPVARWLADPGFAVTCIHPDDRDRVLTLSRAAVAEGRDYDQEFRGVSANGRVLWLRDVVRVVRDAESRPRRLRGVTLDLTARRQAEEALRERDDQLRQAQKMDAVGRLAGGVAHDFNNLMTAIMIYGDLLLNGLHEGHPLRHPAEQIRKVADRAAALVRQLLAFSRRQLLQPKLVSLNTVVADLELMLHRLVGENVAVVTVLDPGLCRVKADPGQLEQVIVNLAVNARDAMPQGGRLTIATATAEPEEDFAQQHIGTNPGPHAVLSVTDTGVGMDAEIQARMFEPFFTTKEPGKGTGLGLSTVYGIVQQHQGAIAVESVRGQGTSIRIFLPQAADDAEGVEAGPSLPLAPRGAETILLVEDEMAVRESVREVLRDSGYTVLEAANGQEALGVSAAHEGRIDLLLTDVVMPLMSGPRLVRRLVQERPEVRVLYMSGYADEALEALNTTESSTAFLQKPFTQEALTRAIREVLDAPGAPA